MVRDGVWSDEARLDRIGNISSKGRKKQERGESGPRLSLGGDLCFEPPPSRPLAFPVKRRQWVNCMANAAVFAGLLPLSALRIDLPSLEWSGFPASGGSAPGAGGAGVSIVCRAGPAESPCYPSAISIVASRRNHGAGELLA